MTKSILTSIALMFVFTIARAQSPMQFSGLDCNGNSVDLFADLDAGKAVVLHFYMPSCGTCPPSAQKIQTMATAINARYPGMVKGYAFPYQNSTTCSYSASWVSSSGLGTLYAPMDSGAAHVANYGGFGMPTIVLLGGAAPNRRVMFVTQSFITSDTTLMRDSILALLSPTGISDLPSVINSINVFPNPASDVLSVSIDLKEATNLLIEMTDISGRQMEVILNEMRQGVVTKQLDTTKLPNGTYLIRIGAGERSLTRKITVCH